ARLLAAAARLLADKVVEGAQADVQRCRQYAESSPAIATSLNRYLGYEEVAAIAKQAQLEQRSIADVVRARGHVEAGTISPEQLNSALDVLGMTLSPRSGDKL
ncbi:MAG: aspartate ammonia-lyase, partial [Pseudonocardiales bacterium]